MIPNINQGENIYHNYQSQQLLSTPSIHLKAFGNNNLSFNTGMPNIEGTDKKLDANNYSLNPISKNNLKQNQYNISTYEPEEPLIETTKAFPPKNNNNGTNNGNFPQNNNFNLNSDYYKSLNPFNNILLNNSLPNKPNEYNYSSKNYFDLNQKGFYNNANYYDSANIKNIQTSSYLDTSKYFGSIQNNNITQNINNHNYYNQNNANLKEYPSSYKYEQNKIGNPNIELNGPITLINNTAFNGMAKVRKIFQSKNLPLA